jgi:hypothetical protein
VRCDGVYLLPTSSSPLASGSSISGFQFSTTETLAQLQTNSTFYSGTSQLTSEVTVGSGGGTPDSSPFTIAVAVPEPANVVPILAGLAGVLTVIRLRHRKPLEAAK